MLKFVVLSYVQAVPDNQFQWHYDLKLPILQWDNRINSCYCSNFLGNQGLFASRNRGE